MQSNCADLAELSLSAARYRKKQSPRSISSPAPPGISPTRKLHWILNYIRLSDRSLDETLAWLRHYACASNDQFYASGSDERINLRALVGGL